jgi:hypothetical protein
MRINRCVFDGRILGPGEHYAHVYNPFYVVHMRNVLHVLHFVKVPHVVKVPHLTHAEMSATIIFCYVNSPCTGAKLKWASS